MRPLAPTAPPLVLTPEHVARAAARRAGVIPGSCDVLRLVDDAADGCPDLVVDRYGPVLRLELRAKAIPAWLTPVARALLEQTGAAHAVGLAREKGAASTLAVLVGQPPAAHVVHEEGRRYLVRTADATAPGTGVFVDQRCARARVQDRARGAVVLNLFAHAGAFGVAAAVGGAARVDHVDAARKCAPWAALNLALNGADPRAHRFLVDDALTVLSKRAKQGNAYDIVICDPPTTARRPDGSRFHVEDDLATLAAECLQCLRPGGMLLLSTNDRTLGVSDVHKHVVAAAARLGIALARIDETPLAEDLPSRSDPVLRPMRGVTAVRT